MCFHVCSSDPGICGDERILPPWETQLALRWLSLHLMLKKDVRLLKPKALKTHLLFAHTSPFAVFLLCPRVWMSVNGSPLRSSFRCEILPPNCPWQQHLSQVPRPRDLCHTPLQPLPSLASPSHCSFRPSYPAQAARTASCPVVLPQISVLVQTYRPHVISHG